MHIFQLAARRLKPQKLQRFRLNLVENLFLLLNDQGWLLLQIDRRYNTVAAVYESRHLLVLKGLVMGVVAWFCLVLGRGGGGSVRARMAVVTLNVLRCCPHFYQHLRQIRLVITWTPNLIWNDRVGEDSINIAPSSTLRIICVYLLLQSNRCLLIVSF